MIVREYFGTRADGERLYRTYSNQSVYIRQTSTGVIYADAVDIADASCCYEETTEQSGGHLWRCRAPGHTSQTGWEPGTTTASLWEQINETHTGELSDPIPYGGNMALSEGLYYIQDYVIYRCTRDTINPVYQPLRELVGIYAEEV